MSGVAHAPNASRARPGALTVTQRLALGLLPALLAVGLVVGLVYYGEYGRAAPSVIVVGAVVLTLASLALTWWNARDLGRRMAHLADTVARVHRLVGDVSAGSDALARTEQVLQRLGDALATSRAEQQRVEAAADARRHAGAVLVERSAAEARAHLDELRLPLHILLESRFGALNENQEELLAAARDAGDAMVAVLRRLERVAAVDGGTLAVQRTLVAPNDVVRAVESQARALAAAHQARFELTLEPALPRAWADRAKLAEALVLILADGARRANEGGRLQVRTERGTGRVGIVMAVEPAGDATAGPRPPANRVAREDDRAVDIVLARALLRAQGAEVEAGPSGVCVWLPTAGA